MKVEIASDDMTFTQVSRKSITASKIATRHTQIMPFFPSRRRQAKKYTMVVIRQLNKHSVSINFHDGTVKKSCFLTITD
jgi:hypothetical protein